MKYLIAKFPTTDEDIMALALEKGWKEKVVDENLLVDGSVPLVPLFNEDGTPKYQMEYTFDEETGEVTSETPRLDENGDPMQAEGPLDVYIDNPQTTLEYLQEKFAEHNTPWLMTVAEKQIKAQTTEAMNAAKAAEADQIEAVKANVKSQIEFIVE